MTRKKIVAGNWKMNNGLQETELLINELAKETNHSGCEVMIAPSFVSLKTSIDYLKNKDIEVVSTGRMTAVNIGEASATDGSQKVLQPVASFEGPFVSGRHEITWTAIDDLGNQSLAVQVIKVLPLANLTPSSLVAEGSVVKIRALISGDAADYPVEIPFTISGSADDETDYQIDQFESFITIDQGR